MPTTEIPAISADEADDQLLTEKEAAQVIGFKPATLRCWRSDGKGPKAKKIGHRVRYTRGALKEWVQGLPEVELLPEHTR